MKNLNREVILYAIQQLKDGIGCDSYGCDLHNEIFNTDYFIIGYYESEKWLNENVGTFKAISDIKYYEEDSFGEVTTDLTSSEKVCNMWVYIEGEKVLAESRVLNNNWNIILDSTEINEIIEELEELL